MIKTFSIAKAYRDKLKTLTTLDIATQGSSYTPTPDKDYIREFLLSGDTVAVGTAQADSEDTQGIYQIDVCTPRAKGKWANLSLCDTLKAGFPRGRHLIHSGQYAVTVDVSVSPMRQDDTHNIHSLSIRYRVVA